MALFNELWGRNTPNSWARVPRGPVAVGVGSFLFGTTATAFTVGAAAVTWGTIGGFLITTAISTWAISALMPKPELGSAERGLRQNVRQATGSFDIVYGEVRKGGVITFMESSGSDNKYLHYVVVLAGHEVDSIDTIHVNDEVASLDGDGFVTGNRWKSKIRVRKNLGSANQTADSALVSETTVTSAFRGRGIAYLYIRLEYDQEVFADGQPSITAVVKGKKVFDPRTSTTVWSDNAALCIRDYLAEEYGLNSKQSPTTLTSNSWAVMANVCDLSIPKKGGGSEKRYTLNGVVSTSAAPRENLTKMLTSCGGTLFWGQGQWQLKVGYLPGGPYVQLGEDDLRSGISLVTKNSRKENFNSVIGIFVDKDQGWIEADYPKVSSSVFLARDNGQDNPLDMTLPYTTSGSAAQRLAKMAMFRSREEIIIGAEFGLKALQLNVGDVVQFTFDRYGFTNKLFEIVSWNVVPNGEELKVALTLKETSAAAYNWNAEENDIIKNNTKLPDPTAGLGVTGLTVTSQRVLQNDGSILGEVVLEWNAAQSAFISNYRVQWKRTSDTRWSSTTTQETSIVIPSVKYGVPYQFRVRATSIGGFVGPWTQVSATLAGKNTPPGIPTNLQAKNLYRAVQVTWDNPTDSDLNHVRIFTNTTNTTVGAIKVGESGGTKFIYDMEPMESRWFFLRAVDHSGNLSPFTAGVQGTALFIKDGDLDIDVKELLADAGLSSVEVVNSLPTTGNFVGRTAYLTTDNQLYSWDGTQWKTATVDVDNVQLTLNNFPSDLRPLEIVNSLPATGNYKGRQVFLTTDNKIYRHTGSPTNASGFTSLVPASDISGQIVGTQITDSAITTPKIATNAVTTNELASDSVVANNIAANAVVFGKVAAGAIGADQIRSNAITAGHLVVTDWTNLVLNADLVSADGWILASDITHVVSTKPSNASAPGNFAIPAITSGAPAARWGSPGLSGRIPCKPDDSFYASAMFRASGAGPNFTTRISAWFYDANGNYVSQVVNSTTITNANYNLVSMEFTIPANIASFQIGFGRNGNPTQNGVGFIEMPSVRRKNGGELIVDGAIKANHMSVNSVTAGVIAAGAINASNLLVDNVITAAKINVNNLSAISANLGSVTAGSININNNFIVNSSGQTTIRSGTSGERLVITNNHISVYDASGTLRVRMGQL